MDNSLDIAPCFYLTINEGGKLSSVNTTICTTLGFSKAELAQQPIDTILPIASRIFYQTHLYPLLTMQRYANEIFMSLRTKDGRQLPALWNITLNDQGFTFLGILVEARKKFEDELIQARKLAQTVLLDNSALKAARENIEENMKEMDRQLSTIRNQFHDLQQFNHVVTHDLQEPLRKIMLFTNILATGNTDLFDKATISNKLVAATDQMKTVIAGLQHYAWLSKTPTLRQELSLANIIADVTQQLSKEHPTINIRTIISALPSVTADETQLRELLYQLLSNTVRFRKKEDEAVIHINGFELDHNEYRHSSDKYAYKKFINIQVRDEGIGFVSEYREQVFDLFRKFHPQSGRGLGLSLCKKIIDNHRGIITAESQPGLGTTITVVLPVLDAENMEIHKAGIQTEA